MEPIDYLHRCNLLDKDSIYFDQVAFVELFREEFLDILNKYLEDTNLPEERHYDCFREVLASFIHKFQAISRLRSQLREDNMGLTRGFWGYIYAQVITPIRDEYFPIQSNAIRARIAKKALKKAQKQLTTRQK